MEDTVDISIRVDTKGMYLVIKDIQENKTMEITLADTYVIEKVDLIKIQDQYKDKFNKLLESMLDDMSHLF